MANSTYAVLQRDAAPPDAIAAPAVVVQRDAAGRYTVQVLDFDRGAPGAAVGSPAAWPVRCVGPAIVGDDIAHLVWAGSAAAPWVLLVVEEENPDEVLQTALLMDPLDCAVRFTERLRLPRLEGVAAFPHGTVLSANGQELHIYDTIELLELRGALGPVSLPVRCRERCSRLDGGVAAWRPWQTRTLALLVNTPASAAWSAGPVTLALPEVADGRDDTAFALRPDDTGLLQVHAAAPVVLLEVQHGCDPDPDPDLMTALTVAHGPTDVYEMNTLPRRDSFVRAAGRRRHGGPYPRDLIVLAQPTCDLELRLPVSVSRKPRCVREIVGYTLRLPQGLTQGGC